MVTSTEGMLDIRQSALGNRLERETKRKGTQVKVCPPRQEDLRRASSP